MMYAKLHSRACDANSRPNAPLVRRRNTRDQSTGPLQPSVASRRIFADHCMKEQKEGPENVRNASKNPTARMHLRILCTTDLHGHIWPYDYQTDRLAPGRGIAALAKMIAAARSETANSVLLDCGDILQGTALADWAVSPAASGQDHPMILSMNHIGYDAATLGNHDFNYGLETLAKAMESASFPIVSANLVAQLGDHPADDTPIVPPWCILERQMTDTNGQDHTLRIGVIGTAPPQTAIWDAAVLRGAVSARDSVKAVRAHLPYLQQAGCDIVVAISHSGLGVPDAADMSEDTSHAIAQIDGIDVILTGHSHRRLPGPDFEGTPGVDAKAGQIEGKPAAMAGAFGSDLAVLDLDLACVGGKWRPRSGGAELRPSSGTSPDPAILALTETAHTATRAQLSQVVAHTRTRLHTAFAMTGRSPALDLMAQAQHAAATALIADTPLADLPLLSAVAPFKHGGPMGPEGFIDIPPGPLRQRHMVELSPFPNQLCVLALTGADLRAWLERAASVYGDIAPGALDAALLSPFAPAYTYDEIHGVRYGIDLSQARRHDPKTGRAVTDGRAPGRITSITYNGRTVGPNDRFAVATNSYRASGGGGFAMIPASTPRLHSRAPLIDVLTDFVLRLAEIDINTPAPWYFEPLGATLLVQSAPSATADSHGDPDRTLTQIGYDSEGYSLFRLQI
ncbi:bifunctional 2',3'-cyclic-nucleotide 2'-phosphodiesterase/3'-nucleotidase [Rhodobacteraceae bacterium SC52]|nr:bifunctional 2',3'-cyclic-nucleotide 2'-phosphodiesterase/3'-nucleotidase [Rhodobacteraceae bacterium SC52]